MNILVDTCVWSLALRRKPPSLNRILIDNLAMLIKYNRARITGPIRQELLSGVRDEKHFSVLKEKLRSFEDLPTNTPEFELAAEMFSTCRKQGIKGSHIDFLICAVAQRNSCAIFTTDGDFSNYGKHLDIRLYTVNSS